MRKKIKRQQERERARERERRRVIFTSSLQANLFHRKASTTIGRSDRIEILEQIPQVSNEFDLKLYLIESKIFFPLMLHSHVVVPL